LQAPKILSSPLKSGDWMWIIMSLRLYLREISLVRCGKRTFHSERC
jgi:hypothetical protein